MTDHYARNGGASGNERGSFERSGLSCLRFVDLCDRTAVKSAHHLGAHGPQERNAVADERQVAGAVVLAPLAPRAVWGLLRDRTEAHKSDGGLAHHMINPYFYTGVGDRAACGDLRV
jgi:hypothetical protein